MEIKSKTPSPTEKYLAKKPSERSITASNDDLPKTGIHFEKLKAKLRKSGKIGE